MLRVRRMNPVTRIRQVTTVAGAAVLAACSSSPSSQSAETTAAKVETTRAETLDRMDQSAQVVSEIRAKIPDEIAAGTKCVVVFPNLVKAGVIIGGQGGKGFATCHNASGWSAPAPISIGGGTLGAQLGAQSTQVLALVQTEKGMRALESGNLRVGVDASASAGPVGTGRGSSTSFTEGGDFVSYSHAKGLYAGANLDGTTIKQDDDVTRALYGSPQRMQALLTGGVPAPSEAPSQRLLGAVRSGFAVARRVSTLVP